MRENGSRGAGTILTTVCAPYGKSISAAELAQRIGVVAKRPQAATSAQP